jgi:hypothetical protein
MAALISAAHPPENWIAVRNRILTGGDPSDETSQTITRVHADVMGAITCSGGSLFAPLLPAKQRIVTTSERGVVFSALNVQCGTAAGAPTVEISPGDVHLQLRDDGAAPDDVAGDGSYAALWTPSAAGEYTFHFNNGYEGTIYVSPYEWTEEASTYRDLEAARATYVSQTTTVTPPMPISFAGNAYSSLTLDSRGFITFDARTGVSQHEPLPTNGAQTLLAPWWSEFVPRNAAAMRWAVLGAAPDRELVLEWNDMAPRSCSPVQGAKFQAVFSEQNADVLFNYSRTEFGGDCGDNNYAASGAIGVQLSNDIALAYSYDQPLLRDGLSLRWQANLPANPTPAITAIQPDTWAVDTSPVAVIVRGTGFTPGSVVLWNGQARPTTFISETEIYVLANAADLAAAATHQIGVFNARPGGGATNAAAFVVHAPDFTLRSSSQSLIAKTTDASTLTLTIEPVPVFRSEVTFTCAGLPSGMQCKFTPASVTPGTLPAVVSVAISAAAQGTTQSVNLARGGRLLGLTNVAFGLIAVGLVIRRKPTAAETKTRAASLLLILICSALLLSSCGGGGGQTSVAPANPPISSTVSAPMVITATGAGIAHTQTVTVTYTE